MVQYNFKKIIVFPPEKDFIDIILSRTQRQTPTVVHKGYAINRICQFYMRTDHYKLSLGQINTARNIIAKISKDYLRLLKYGDTLYRCKCLKVAALGRICTVLKGISPSLAYLEQIRQHMARLPSVDPNTRTILICGYPNVGKSSFMNMVTRADVDVQPYAFTTKSLFVGHADYKYLRYQVIDTPGILDRPFEDWNIIEMCSITALAHLRAAVLFFLDFSRSCGIKSLFMNKPLVIVCNKTDLQPLDGLSEEDMNMSALMDEGVMAVKNAACERLLEQRVEIKMKSKKINDCLNRFHVAMPKPRAGVYSASLKKHYLLANDEWKEDISPGILDGHNVADFLDPDILERCEEMEREEGLRLEEEAAQDAFMIDGHDELTEEQREILGKIRKKKAMLIQEHRMKKSTAESRNSQPRDCRQLTSMGVDPTAAVNRLRNQSRGRKRERSLSRADGDDAMDVDGQHSDKKLRTMSRSRSKSRPIEEVVPEVEGLCQEQEQGGRRGEADRVIPTLKPKHLFSEKRGIGKTSRR
ncbi:hypothetical protein VPH35_084766 [Triticum aestivum]